MKVELNKRDDGVWQADIVLPDGTDHHAIGRDLAEALIELGMYLKTVRPKSDLQVLAETVVGSGSNQATLARKLEALEDIARLEGTGKWAHPGNMCFGDGIFAKSICQKYALPNIEAVKRWAQSG